MFQYKPVSIRSRVSNTSAGGGGQVTSSNKPGACIRSFTVSASIWIFTLLPYTTDPDPEFLPVSEPTGYCCVYSYDALCTCARYIFGRRLRLLLTARWCCYQQNVVEEKNFALVLSDTLTTCRVDDLLKTTVADETSTPNTGQLLHAHTRWGRGRSTTRVNVTGP